MANARTFSRSFSGGEVTPEFWGRIDDTKYQSGLALCRNFIALPHGPIANRPGTKFVREVKSSSKRTRLIPFTYSSTQTMVLEFGDYYIRFHTLGASLLAGTPQAYSAGTSYIVSDSVTYSGARYYCTRPAQGIVPTNTAYWYRMPDNGVYEIPSPYKAQDVFDIHYVQSADVLTLVHPGYAPRELRRLGATRWRLDLISTAPKLSPPAGGQSTGAVNITHRYTVTAMMSRTVTEQRNFTEYSSWATPIVFEEKTVTNEVTALGGDHIQGIFNKYGKTQGVFWFKGLPNPYLLYGVEYINPTLEYVDPATQLPPGYTNADIGMEDGQIAYGPVKVVDGVQWTLYQMFGNFSRAVYYYTEMISRGGLVFTSATRYSYPVTYTQSYETIFSSEATCSNDLNLVGAANKLSWSPISGASGYRVYKYNHTDNQFYFLGAATDTTFRDDSVRTAGIDKTLSPPASALSAGPSGMAATAVTAAVAELSVSAFVPEGGSPDTKYTYVVTAFSERTGEESGPSSKASTMNDLFTTGAKNTLTWPFVAGADYYNVYREVNGVFGYLGRSTENTFIDTDYLTPDISKTPPIINDVFAGNTNWPGAVTYYEQRRIFAGSRAAPQSIWMTRPGTESDMSYSMPSREDDAISFRVAAREANTIRHAVPLNSLVLMTASAEWQVTSVNSDAITPTSISVKPQSYVGANNVQPVIVNNTLVYVAERGGHVRELGYNWQAGGYITGDASIRAPHLFDGLDVVDIAYQKSPSSIVWAVSTSGKLLGMTYSPEQQIIAWHQHDTDGVFESVCCVAEGDHDAVYLVVRRTVGGVSKRYIERMEPRLFGEQENAFFLDCGLTYRGAPVSSVTGLAHLNGKTVSILADGAAHAPKVVTGGAVALDVPASVVHVGLPYVSDLQTLPLALEIKGGGFAQGRPKNVNQAWLRVFRSGELYVGPDFDRLTRARDEFGVTGIKPLRTEEIQVTVSPSWAPEGSICLRNTAPLPLTVVSMSLEVSIGG